MASTIAEIKAAVEVQKLNEEKLRREIPLVRLWDAEWNLQFALGNEYSAKFSWVSNDTGPGQLELPFDCAAAQWIYDYQSRLDNDEGHTIGVTVDYQGMRWNGVLDKFAVEQREDGDVVLVVDLVHDYEHLKFYTMVSNPFLVEAIQFPRAWLVAGPITWILRLSLFMCLFREHNPVLTFPDDPLDLDNWLTMGLDMSEWHVVVKPESFLDALASGVAWGVATARWTNLHDMMHYILEDGELSVECRRYLPGDDPPWEGANLRYGALVVDFIDKSGIFVGTSHGGSIFDGLTRTVTEFADDFLDSSLDVVTDAATPGDYFTAGKRFTDPVKPYVVFYEGDTSPIQSSSWVYQPTKCVQVECGGHSMPGVVCAPPGNWWGTDNLTKSTRRFQPLSRASATYSAVWCSSDRWAAPMIPCSPRSMRTFCSRFKRSRVPPARTTLAGQGCTPSSKMAGGRRTPFRRCSCCGRRCGPRKPRSVGRFRCRTGSPTCSVTATRTSGTSG